MDPSTSTVRDHIEKVVESLIGEDLDSVNIIHITDRPSYLRLFEDYHVPLSDSLALLTQAIQLVIGKHPTSQDDPTPTTAHIKLKYWIERLVMDVDENEPIFDNEKDLRLRQDLPMATELYYSQSYEDILSTAIINKVVLSSSKKRRPNTHSDQDPLSADRLSHGATSMDQEQSSFLNSSQSTRSETSASNPGHSGSSLTSSSDRCHSTGSTLSSPSDEEIHSAPSSFDCQSLSSMEKESRESSISPTDMEIETPQFLIEEEIQETTAYQSEDDVDSRVVKTTIEQTSTLSKYPSMHSMDCVLADIVRFEMEEPVAFPEFGMDLVDRDCKHANDQSTLPLSTSTWEDNWLFCQKRLKARNSFRVNRSALFYNEPVAMLVPNPNEDQVTRAMIGNREIDELSELSERQSVASLEYSTSSSAPSDEEDAALPSSSEYPSLEGQKDLEHTEYAVLPNQRQRKRDPEELSPTASISPGDLSFLESPTGTVNVMAGKTARLKAVVQGSRPIDVLWFRGSKLLENSASTEIRRSREGHELILHHTDVHTAGHYSCAVVNKTGELWTRFQIDVRKSPDCPWEAPAILETPDDLVLEEGQSARFGCVIGGFPEPRVSFMINSRMVNPNEIIDIDVLPNGTHSLAIRRCQVKHNGKLTVRAENVLGSVEESWRLEVHPLHEQPLASSAEDSEYCPSVNMSMRDFSIDEVHRGAFNETEIFSSRPTSEGEEAMNGATVTEARNVALVNEAKNRLVVSTSQPVEPDDDAMDGDLELIDLDGPQARPGTIADREHRKWTENAISLQNNPYSKENIERRLSSRGSRDSLHQHHSTSSADFVRSVNSSHNDLMMTLNAPRKIDCGLHSINSARYRRDYYINDESLQLRKLATNSWPSHRGSSAVPGSKESIGGQSIPEPRKSAQVKLAQPMALEDETPIGEKREAFQVTKPKLDGQTSPSSKPKKDFSKSKVEEEVAKFQQQIERNFHELSKAKAWERRKSTRLGSMDSLLSADSDYSSGRSVPPLPPKGRYVSQEPLSRPSLPPKTKVGKASRASSLGKR
eukprot:maker-scaffold186_size273091-snap-gene-1.42 protein:Tk00922 transcript:maker-scaffold186_size273091-snap-gene-1.42-mRNA-1 annotation:"hypothetical protein L798_13875"